MYAFSQQRILARLEDTFLVLRNSSLQSPNPTKVSAEQEVRTSHTTVTAPNFKSMLECDSLMYRQPMPTYRRVTPCRVKPGVHHRVNKGLAQPQLSYTVIRDLASTIFGMLPDIMFCSRRDSYTIREELAI